MRLIDKVAMWAIDSIIAMCSPVKCSSFRLGRVPRESRAIPLKELYERSRLYRNKYTTVIDNVTTA